MTGDRRDGGTGPANVVIMLDGVAENGARVDWVHLQGDDRDELDDVDRAIEALTATRKALVAERQAALDVSRRQQGSRPRFRVRGRLRAVTGPSAARRPNPDSHTFQVGPMGPPVPAEGRSVP